MTKTARDRWGILKRRGAGGRRRVRPPSSAAERADGNRLGQGECLPFRREALTFMPMNRNPGPAGGSASGCGQWQTKAAPLGPCAGLALTGRP